MEGLMFCVHDKRIRHSVCMCNSSLISPHIAYGKLIVGCGQECDPRSLPAFGCKLVYANQFIKHFDFGPSSLTTVLIEELITQRLRVCDRHLPVRMLYILISCFLRVKGVYHILYLCCPSFGFHNSEPYNATMRRNIR